MENILKKRLVLTTLIHWCFLASLECGKADCKCLINVIQDETLHHIGGMLDRRAESGLNKTFQFSSVQFSLSVKFDSLRPHALQHTRPPCPSPTPGVYSHSCPLSRWCHPTISSSVDPFSSCLQCFPASGSLQMSQLFTSGGRSIGVSASASVLPMNTQDWFPLGWTGWISLQSKGLSRISSNTTVKKHHFFCTQLSL